MAAKRYRLRFTFWLDVTKDDEYELAGQIEDLKTERLFSQTIRDGIRLLCDLRAGRTDVLFTLFPWLAAEFAGPGEGEEWSLEQQLEELRHLILSQNGVTPGEIDNRFANIQSLHQVAAGEDDEDIKLEVTRSSDGTSAQNFLNSLLNLQS